MSNYEFDIAAAPDTAPFQCVCGKGLPGDGPFVRLPARTQYGDVWLCGHCQEHVLGANRLMPVRLYEERLADVHGAVEAQTEALRAERERLADIEQRWTTATTEAREATARAELAESVTASLRQEIASTNAVLLERTSELEAARRGSITVKSVDEHFDRMVAICEENAGPERKTKPKTTKQEVAA